MQVAGYTVINESAMSLLAPHNWNLVDGHNLQPRNSRVE